MIYTKYISATILIALLVISGCQNQQKQGDAALLQPEFNVGFLILDIKNEQRNVTVAVWYPTKDTPTEYQYQNPQKTVSMIAFEGKPYHEYGPFPLIVYSHGYGAGALTGIYLAEYLAGHGYIVAAPDHTDEFTVMRITGGGDRDMREYFKSALNLANSGKDFDRDAFSYRPEDISFVIDEMLHLNRTKSVLQGCINEKLIGGMGHSLGGYTMLMVGGIDQEYYDPRITALLLLSGGVFMFDSQEYTSISVPVMFMYGEKEGSLIRANVVNDKASDTQTAYENCYPPTFLLVIKGGNHFSFGQTVFQDSWPGMGEKEGHKQADVICRYGLAFFEVYIKGNNEFKEILYNDHAMLAHYENQLK